MSSDILRTACPKCDKRLKIPADVQGKRIKCSRCGHRIAAEEPPPRGRQGQQMTSWQSNKQSYAGIRTQKDEKL